MTSGFGSLYEHLARVAEGDDLFGARTRITRAKETVDADVDTSLLYQSTALLASGQAWPTQDASTAR
jgi:hypothetical protein